MTSTPTEFNGKQTNGSILGKRKKVREKRSNYLQKWLEKTLTHSSDIPETDIYEGYSHQVPMTYWNPPQPIYGQRLFNATSDPSVFRYSTPYGYTNEAMSLPVYPGFPNIPDWGNQNNMKYVPHAMNKNNNTRYQTRPKRTSNKKSVENEYNKIPNGHGINRNSSLNTDPRSNTSPSVSGTNNDFASLPPIVNTPANNPFNHNTNEENDNTGNKRRFSDPGIAQNQSFDPSQDDSDESDSETSSVMYAGHSDNRLIMCLVDQINSLKETNRKLYKELHDTRGELDALKQQTSIWRGDAASSLGMGSQTGGNVMGGPGSGMAGSSVMYAPGMLADLVREIRDAARIREEALYTKVRNLLDERNSNVKTNGYSPMDKSVPDWRNYEHLKNHIQPNVLEKSRTNDRLGKLEEELHNLRIQQSREESMASPGVGFLGSPPPVSSFPDHDKIRLKMELNEERSARMAADAHAHKLELLVTHLRSKRGTSSSGGGGGGQTSAAPSDALHMVLGPVTDL